MAGEGQLCLVLEVLVMEDRRGVAVDGLPDVRDGFGRQRPREVDAGDFADEEWMKLLNFQTHWTTYSRNCVAHLGESRDRQFSRSCGEGWVPAFAKIRCLG